MNIELIVKIVVVIIIVVLIIKKNIRGNLYIGHSNLSLRFSAGWYDTDFVLFGLKLFEKMEVDDSIYLVDVQVAKFSVAIAVRWVDLYG